MEVGKGWSVVAIIYLEFIRKWNRNTEVILEGGWIMDYAFLWQKKDITKKEEEQKEGWLSILTRKWSTVNKEK